ncbi:MAG: arginine--tRNA ligase [Chloroflexi bacterium]|nr:arginine--tRNA ligase [Chloroflexota bacterium]
MTAKKEISDLLVAAAQQAMAAGDLPSIALPDATVEHPQKSGFGDYASSIALKLSRAAKPRQALDIAKILVSHLPASAIVGQAEVAPPGFINFTLSDNWLKRQVETIVAAGDEFGSVDLGKREKVQVEFVSANPVGPLHVGNGRGAILGSTLANILAKAGQEVTREYYLNDAGSQLDAFFRTLWARYRQALGQEAEIPADGYAGTYMSDLAGEIVASEGDRFLRLPEAEALTALGQLGMARIIDWIKTDLRNIGVEFDVWFSEKSLYANSQFDQAFSLLKERGYVVEREGAVWFASTALGEDKDTVVIRSNGTPTYFASDIAYHYNKFVERGFDRVIDIWGADHQGHVNRMKVVLSALGIDPSRLGILITQLVTLKRGSEVIKISKRTGDIITLREVIEEVGADACRFFFLARSADSQMDFDLALAKEQSQENPVYYVQYAHARIASILRTAAEKGIGYEDGDVDLLSTEPELTLIRKMLEFPELVELAAVNLEPHHLPHYSQELAGIFHSFYKQCRVISEDDQLTKARLKLVHAAKIALANALDLMGMTAPERM